MMHCADGLSSLLRKGIVFYFNVRNYLENILSGFSFHPWLKRIRLTTTTGDTLERVVRQVLTLLSHVYLISECKPQLYVCDHR